MSYFIIPQLISIGPSCRSSWTWATYTFTFTRLPKKSSRKFTVASALNQHIKDLPAPAHTFHNAHVANPSSPASSNFTKSSTASNRNPFVRPALPKISTMKFWDKLFRPAMRELQNRDGPCYSLPEEFNIRRSSSWEEVEKCLLRARERYDGRRGRFKDCCRRVADYGHVGAQAIEAVKVLEYMSVVMGIVKVLVDAAIVASRVREHARASLDPRMLKRQFAQIEVLLMLHPKDRNIREAATALVVDILEAIEEGIAFFVKSRHRRAVAAIAHGDKYQQRFLNKLESVRESCKWLKENGHFSSTYFMLHAVNKLLQDQEANRGTELALGQTQQQVVNYEVSCPRSSHLEFLASRLEGGIDRLEAFGHKLESGVLRALCSISSCVSHMNGMEGQHQLSLEQEVEGQNELVRVISEGFLSEVRMLEDESDDDSEEALSD